MKSHFLLFAFGLIHLAGAQSAAGSIILNVGEEYRIPLPANRRLWFQNRKVLHVTTRGAHVVLTGNQEGHTSAMVGKDTYQFQVVLPLKKNLLARFEKETRHMLGLKIKITQQQVTVSGKLLRWEDWLSLVDISRELEVPYHMSAEIPESIRSKARHHWQEQLELANLPPLPVQFNRPLQARLSSSAAIYDKYLQILSPFGVNLEKDAEALTIAPIVKIEITVAEVRRDFHTHYGIQWPAGYSATLMPDGQSTKSNLEFLASALESQGRGKILASPSLLCRSGKEAEFLAGGEFPIKIMSVHMQDVVWKKYGVLLKVRPKADASGRMSIALEVEVSTIDGTRAVDGIPGLLTNRMSSHFDLSKSQTIALSGLIKNEESKSNEGLPLLSRIPILGALFSSKDFKENRTELVIFVRPSIMKEATELALTQAPKHLGETNHE